MFRSSILTVFGLITVLASSTGLRAQGPSAAADSFPPVLPANHSLRPQRPPDVGHLGALGMIGAALEAPFTPLGQALRSGARYYEEHCGSPSGGLARVSVSACLPPYLSVHLGSIGSRSGFLGGGVGLHQSAFRTTGLQVGVTAAATARAYQTYTAYLGWNDPTEYPAARLTGFYDLDAQNDFWGLGPGSSEDNRADYAWERFGARLDVGVPPRRGFSGAASLTYERSIIFEGGNDREKDAADVFPEVAGVGAPQQEFWIPAVEAAFDLTDASGHPTRGVRIAGRAAVYRSIDHQPFDWTRYGVEAQGHLPLGTERHVVSLLAGLDRADPHGRSEIPFPYLPSLGGSRRLRGYDPWRWTDHAAGFATAEYRYRIWQDQGPVAERDRASVIEAAIFTDVGDVAPDLDALDLDDLKTAYGLEFRIYVLDRHAFRTGLAFSEEGPRFNLSATDVWEALWRGER